MTVHMPDETLAAAIAEAVGGLVRDYTGREPTQRRAVIRDNLVVVLVEDRLAKGEQTLVQHGRGSEVLAVRESVHDAMQEDCVQRIEQLTGRRVVARMNTTHVDPDLAAEVYVLEGAPGDEPQRLPKPTEILDAMRRWEAEHGRPPEPDDWPEPTDDHPSADTVVQSFGSWKGGLAAAGDPAHRRGPGGPQPPER